jgi:predicted ArsR family transcriptional regulator
MGSNQDGQAMAAIALLADELRQRLYRFVAAQPDPVTRDQAAAAVGISRKLAAFHLDKLVSAGLLEATTPEPASRRPGPGRALTVASELLTGWGYAPARTPTQRQLLLCSCPFQQLARRGPGLQPESALPGRPASWATRSPSQCH